MPTGVNGDSNIVSLQKTWSESVQHLASQLLVEQESKVSELRLSDTHDSQDAALLRPVMWMDVREVVEVKNHCPFVFK
jgi:hypothetical protein